MIRPQTTAAGLTSAHFNGKSKKSTIKAHRFCLKWFFFVFCSLSHLFAISVWLFKWCCFSKFAVHSTADQIKKNYNCSSTLVTLQSQKRGKKVAGILRTVQVYEVAKNELQSQRQTHAMACSLSISVLSLSINVSDKISIECIGAKLQHNSQSSWVFILAIASVTSKWYVTLIITNFFCFSC